MKKHIGLFLLFFVNVSILCGQVIEYKTEKNISYYPSFAYAGDEYKKERCALDVYYPTNVKGFATIVWFHGGGLTGGKREIPEELQNKGYCVVGVGYRLSPKVKAPVYIEDAAAGLAWVFKNITRLGGDSSLIFLSGHSAGGYLDLMLGLDKEWLKPYEINPDRIAGLIPFSPQTITHFTVRKERGIKSNQPIIDNLAPIYYVRGDAPAILLITGDREKELFGRYEENAYFMRMMKLNGQKKIQLFELAGYDHNMVYPAIPLLLNEVKMRVDLMHAR